MAGESQVPRLDPIDPAPTAEPAHVDCTVIVVTYNSERHIAAFLESISRAAGDLSWHVIVVDNDSTDSTLTEVARFPWAQCVATGRNAGYSAGINVGRRNAGPCDALLISNPDVRLEAGAIEVLHRAVTEGGHGAAVPLLVDAAGHLSPSVRREPTVLGQLGEALFGNRFSRRPAFLSETVRDPSTYESPHSIDWAGGAVLMVAATCDADVGPWEESFFLFSEETDYAARIRDSGRTIGLVPGATATHDEGVSGRGTPLRGLMAVNRLRYFRGRHGSARSALYALALLLQLLLRSFDARHRAALPELARAAVPGVVAGRFPPPSQIRALAAPSPGAG